MKNKWGMFLATLFLTAVVTIFTIDSSKADAATPMVKQLDKLENPTWLRNQGLTKGIDHDRQDLGVLLPGNATIEIRQINPKFKEQLKLELLNDDNRTEKSYSIGSSWTLVTATSDSVPFIKTTFTSEAPVVEYRVSATAIDLPVFKQGDQEADFFEKWDKSQAAFGLIRNEYIQILVPVRDKSYLKKMNDFPSINALFNYYDALFETYNELEGLSFTPKKATDKNIANRYFVKADKNGVGAAYYGVDYTAETGASVVSFWLRPYWGGLHEIGHGYQGDFMSDSSFNTSEVWNNIYADTMQKKLLGSTYSSGWLYENNTARLENTFEKNVYTTKINANNWDGRSKLYLLTLMKDKAGDQAFTHFNQSYRAAVASNTLNKDLLLLDLVSKYLGEASHYDFTAFLELVQGSMSNNQKLENVYSGNKAVYPLAALFSGSNLTTARKDIKLDSKWGLVSNEQLEKYKVKNTINIRFDINDFAQLKGKVLRIKDGADVIRKIKITSPIMTIKDMPIGIYSLDMPTGVSRFYEPASNYLAVSDDVSDMTIRMEELQTSTVAVEKMIFQGLGNVVFATATVDPENNSFELDVTKDAPHSYFADEYASIEVLDNQGKSVFKKGMNGEYTAIGKWQVPLKLGYTIRITHREPNRFNINGAPAKLVNLGSTQIFKVTKYGLMSDITGVTANDALDNYKVKLMGLAATINSNSIFKKEKYVNLKTKLRKGIDYLPEVDKIYFENMYKDLLFVSDEEDESSEYMFFGDKFRFDLRGFADWEFADLNINLATKQATFAQKTGQPNGDFAGTYASVSVYDKQGQLVHERKFNGRGYVPGYVKNMKIEEGYYITIMHEEYEGRLLFTNLETQKMMKTSKQVTYKVMVDGLLELPMKKSL
ncbi:putative mucin/carbohydrate-binding domain-containing protein [Listeria newyorkensis]|uniref:putative mucin/carbohydrate-binding domain-containing protein n=1 Tax=Listeria newyorkensis TaxID=1497681 RepID=UPI000669EFF2|nr:putative mucin/carbohydrate-binding domain-containing protein [Listeria newyorkensis]KMT62438.1 putative enhancing factor (viral) [Listeria newyorkensis]